MRNLKSDRSSLINLLNIPFWLGVYIFFGWLDHELLALSLVFVGPLIFDYYLGSKGSPIPDWVVDMGRIFRLVGITFLFSFCALLVMLFLTDNLEELEPLSLTSALLRLVFWLGVSMAVIGEHSVQLKNTEQAVPGQPQEH